MQECTRAKILGLQQDLPCHLRLDVYNNLQVKFPLGRLLMVSFLSVLS